jgi:hypothetical protein
VSEACGDRNTHTIWWGAERGASHHTMTCTEPKNHDSPWHTDKFWVWAQAEYRFGPRPVPAVGPQRWGADEGTP